MTMNQLITRRDMFKRNSLADSTIKLRVSQWRCYKNFCVKFKLPVTPCTDDQLSLYCSYMSEFLSYTSIVSYCQSVIFWHKYFDVIPPTTASPVMHITLLGIKRRGPVGPQTRDPLLPNHLKSMLIVLKLNRSSHALFWAAILLMFRSLLRV